jgi:hypothetical protein
MLVAFQSSWFILPSILIFAPAKPRFRRDQVQILWEEDADAIGQSRIASRFPSRARGRDVSPGPGGIQPLGLFHRAGGRRYHDRLWVKLACADGSRQNIISLGSGAATTAVPWSGGPPRKSARTVPRPALEECYGFVSPPERRRDVGYHHRSDTRAARYSCRHHRHELNGPLS